MIWRHSFQLWACWQHLYCLMSVTDWCFQWTQVRVRRSIHALRAIPSPRHAEHKATAGIPTVFVNRARGSQSSFTWLARICCSLWYKCLRRALALPLSVSLSLSLYLFQSLCLSLSLSLTLTLSLSLLYREKSICGGTRETTRWKKKKEKDKWWGKCRIGGTQSGLEEHRKNDMSALGAEPKDRHFDAKTVRLISCLGKETLYVTHALQYHSNGGWNVCFVCCLYGLRNVRCVCVFCMDWGTWGVCVVCMDWGTWGLCVCFLYGLMTAIQLLNIFKLITTESVVTDIRFGDIHIYI